MFFRQTGNCNYRTAVALREPIVGKRVLLRSASEDDAEFILKLRLDPRLNRYIGATDPSVEKQKEYIRERRDKEDDYHMIIESHEGRRIGIIALCEIDWTRKSFVWGRWVIDPEMPGYATESLLLLYHFAFDVLNLETARMHARKGNTKAIAIHKRLGAEVTDSDDENMYFEFPRRKFEALLQRYKDRHAVQC